MRVTYSEMRKLYSTEIGRVASDLKLSDKVLHYSCGKEAIAALLRKLNLSLNDEVYIDSTFNTKYVSSCVTSTIFNICKPSKIITENTRLIFIIHDFGFPNERVFELKKYSESMGIPIVEDCAQSAYSFFSNGLRIGTIGNYSIYSLKKILPYDNAGLLMDNNIDTFPYLDEVSAAAKERRNNFKIMTDIFTRLNITPAFDINEKISPYVFPFKVLNDKENILSRLKDYDCIYWVNLDVYTLPVHQYLKNKYFNKIIKSLS